MYPICFKFQATQVFLGSLHSNWQLYWGKWVWYIEPSIVIQKSKFSVFLPQHSGSWHKWSSNSQRPVVMCILCQYPNTDDSMTHFEFHRDDRYLNHFIITHYCVRVMWNISWFLMGRLLFLSLFGDTCGAIKSWGNSWRQECMDHETWKFQSCKSSRDATLLGKL
jgi:hypothetical protein